MHWYNYEQRHPKAFDDFCIWYKANYPVEFKDCSHPVYKEERLLEYFSQSGLPITLARENTGHWNVKVGKQFQQGLGSEREALRAGIYTAFGLREQVSN
jgi:hypothetical protein